ncbi:RNA polymerase sigma factor [Mucilaginibacter segetis]|uniref:Sigma-70 family RNA polymerase sigma factor n=1 Tax=Mucilaginibacter segetis TaxID=2793071 RepID=A0A934UKR5_9SPHI|nr:sigma-70 family RNA polymerase sigma factor [Mucilaginibacter segetis]MBK0377738.1 sigma-70 family RNA polymerase sigma factor [Mucilaginibacter segetis]
MNVYTKTYLTEAEIVTAIKTKSRTGAEALYDMYARTLFYSIIRIVKTREVAEDVLQKVFLKIWNSFNLYDPEKGRLYTWMINIARNMAMDELRSKRHHNSLLNQDIESADSSYIEANYQVQVNIDHYGLRNFVNNLKEEQAEILDLVYFKGYSHTEAANKLQLPLGTVKTRVRCGLKALRVFLIKDINFLKTAS